MRILKRIFVNFEEAVAGSALFLMTACVFFNTFGRIFFKKSFAALDELSYLFFAYVIFVGSSALYKRYGHGVIDLLAVGVDPLHDPGSMLDALDAEHGRPRHGILEDGDAHPSAVVDDRHAAGDRCDERALGGRERDEEPALGVPSVDVDRSGVAERNLGRPDHVLDVLGRRLGVHAPSGYLLERRSGEGLGGRAPLLHVCDCVSAILQSALLGHEYPHRSAI